MDDHTIFCWMEKWGIRNEFVEWFVDEFFDVISDFFQSSIVRVKYFVDVLKKKCWWSLKTDQVMELDEINYGDICSTRNILSTNYVGRELIVDTRREKPKVRRKNQNFAQKNFGFRSIN